MKKIILSLLLLLPLGLFAQEVKIAFVDQNQIFYSMPEVSEVESKLALEQKKIEDEVKKMQDEYERKYSDLVSRADSLTENIKKIKAQEVTDLELRIRQVIEVSQEQMSKMQETLLAPIQEKITKAINSVGEENGYSCILPNQLLLFKGKNVIDATPLVKAKLGVN